MPNFTPFVPKDSMYRLQLEAKYEQITESSTKEDIEALVRSMKRQEAEEKYDKSRDMNPDVFSKENLIDDLEYPGIPIEVELPYWKAQRLQYEGVSHSEYVMREEAYDAVIRSEKLLYDIKEEIEDSKASKSSTRYMLDSTRFSVGWKEAIWQGYKLPAQGSALWSCHLWGFRGCVNHTKHPENKNYVYNFKKECARAECPKCVESWTNRLANRAASRCEVLTAKGGKYPNHVVVSIPKSWYELDKKEIDKRLKPLLKYAGINAAIKILHPFRFDESKQLPYASPHYHLIAYGWIENTAEISRKTGVVIKNIRRLKESYQVFSTVKYALTHAGTKKRTHAVVYTGNISYSKLKIEKQDIELELCPFCELEVKPLRIIEWHTFPIPKIKVDDKLLTDFLYLEVVTDNDFHYYDIEGGVHKWTTDGVMLKEEQRLEEERTLSIKAAKELKIMMNQKRNKQVDMC